MPIHDISDMALGSYFKTKISSDFLFLPVCFLVVVTKLFIGNLCINETLNVLSPFLKDSIVLSGGQQ